MCDVENVYFFVLVGGTRNYQVLVVRGLSWECLETPIFCVFTRSGDHWDCELEP